VGASVARDLTRALDHVEQELVLDRRDVHEHHADSVPSIRPEGEASDIGPQRDAACLRASLELQEDEATPRRIRILGEFERRTVE